MPYTISQNNQGEYCVFKQDDKGQPTGETLGCHKTQDEASAQIGAIERSEAGKMLQRYTQQEVNYMPVSTRMNKGEACAACRWYTDECCHVVECAPLTIEPTGLCDRYEFSVTLVVEDDMTVTEVVGDKHAGENLVTRTLDKGLGVIKSILGVGSPDEPGSSVFKALGNGIWFAAYTNNLQDLEGEILKESAHDRYIARLDAGFVPMPQLWHVHEPATQHGQATHVWRDGHVVCAVGRFDNTPAGRAAEKFYQRRKPGEIELSHGFQYPQWAKSPDGVYEEYNTFEISTIYTKYGRAANPFTSFEEINTMALDEKKRQSIEEAFGKDEAARIIAASEKMATRAKALADAGVAYKGDFADLTDTIQKPTPQPEAVKAIISDVLEGQEVILAALEQTKAAYEASLQTLNAQKIAYETRQKALDETIARLQATINAKPMRVDDNQGNTVTDTEAVKTLDAQANVEYDPHYPGMNIPKSNGKQEDYHD